MWIKDLLRTSVASTLTLVLSANFLLQSTGRAAASDSSLLEGAHGSLYLGHTSLQSTVRFPALPTRAEAQFNDVGGNTIYGGGRLGYTLVYGDFLVGVDLAAKAAWEPYPTTILHAAGFNYELSTKWESSVTARAGYIFGGRTAVYLAGGASFSRLDLQLEGKDRSRNLFTPTFGFGAETALNRSWALRLDWMADRSQLHSPLHVTLVRWNIVAGVVYRF